MKPQEDLQATLRRKAQSILGKLLPAEREALLIQCWMSHDARWFMAVVAESGMEVANRVNQAAAHELGKVEARRLHRALQLEPIKSLDDYLLLQELLIGLLGPDLLEYQVNRVNDHTFQVDVQRCFAYDNVAKAGIAACYDCGIFARITGWLDGLNIAYEMSPPIVGCLKVDRETCSHILTLKEASG